MKSRMKHTTKMTNTTATSRKSAAPFKYTVSALLLAAGFIAGSANADYTTHPKYKAFANTIQKENIYPADKLNALLKSAEKQESILEAIARPAEKTFTWGRYRKIFLTPERIQLGVDFYKKHKSALQSAAAKTGVSESVILAILGVETRFGRHKGDYRVVDALATLGFDYPPRGTFFLKQLKAFLQLEAEAGIDLMEATGSYAGAMGYPQFIPTSYRHYAVDFDGDKIIDLINNPEDAIGSIANYFKEHGWKQDAAVTFKAIRKGNNPKLDKIFNDSLKPKHTIKSLNELGLVTPHPLDVNLKATAMRMETDNGVEYWIGLENFYVITRYNHSRLYAMAVYQLSKAIEEKINDEAK